MMWILGADDSEMRAIEVLLRKAGQSFIYAMATDRGGNIQRVAPGQVATGPAIDGDVVAVEVAGPWGQPAVDHHGEHERASWGPDRFLSASSIGQVIERLATLGAIPDGGLLDLTAPRPWARYRITGERPEQWAQAGEFYLSGDGWAVSLGGGWYAHVPTELVFEAAADHCLAAAFAGKCPGISPHRDGPFWGYVVDARRTTFAPGLDGAAFSATIATALHTLRNAAPSSLSPHVRDLRHLPIDGPIVAATGEQHPSLFQFGPLVGSMAGLGYVVHVRKRDGSLALRGGGCGTGTPAGEEPVRIFLSDPSAFGCGPIEPPGADASYGSPARGFFGGTLLVQE